MSLFLFHLVLSPRTFRAGVKRLHHWTQKLFHMHNPLVWTLRSKSRCPSFSHSTASLCWEVRTANSCYFWLLTDSSRWELLFEKERNVVWDNMNLRLLSEGFIYRELRVAWKRRETVKRGGSGGGIQGGEGGGRGVEEYLNEFHRARLRDMAGVSKTPSRTETWADCTAALYSKLIGLWRSPPHPPPQRYWCTFSSPQLKVCTLHAAHSSYSQWLLIPLLQRINWAFTSGLSRTVGGGENN